MQDVELMVAFSSLSLHRFTSPKWIMKAEFSLQRSYAEMDRCSAWQEVDVIGCFSTLNTSLLVVVSAFLIMMYWHQTTKETEA